MNDTTSETAAEAESADDEALVDELLAKEAWAFACDATDADLALF